MQMVFHRIQHNVASAIFTPFVAFIRR